MEKNTIKQFFRSGSRPTQEHFHALVDACYNGEYSIFLSGYALQMGLGDEAALKSWKLEAGQSIVVPHFKSINVPQSRTFHFNLPSSNLGSQFLLSSIEMEFKLPPSSTYEVKHKDKTIEIKQQISLESIDLYNGTMPILNLEKDKIPQETKKQWSVKLEQPQWRGISIAIQVAYDIRSKIAVSDEFDLASLNPDALTHVFGGIGLQFKNKEE